MGKGRAVFVDRDDTLMIDVAYCRNPEEVRLLPRAAEGLRILARGGFAIVVVTNQSGLGRGYFDEERLTAVNARLRSELRSRGADFQALYYCPHRPDESCACRKPQPGLLFRAAGELDLDLTRSYTIGDKGWDVEAGKAAGTRTVLITNGRKFEAQEAEPDFVAKDLVEAARWIVADKATPGKGMLRGS